MHPCFNLFIMRLYKYNNRVYMTFKELAKAIRENLDNASDNIHSDYYLIMQSYKLGEWNYASLNSVLKQHNELVSESREMLNTMNQCVVNLWSNELEVTIESIVIEDTWKGYTDEVISGGKIRKHIKTINKLTGSPLEHFYGTYLKS